MSGRKSRDKGAREERSVVNTHLKWGFECERTLESGARNNSPVTWDINLQSGIGLLRGECKHQEGIGDYLWDWIENRDFLTIRKNRKDRLYVVTEAVWKELMIRGRPQDDIQT